MWFSLIPGAQPRLSPWIQKGNRINQNKKNSRSYNVISQLLKEKCRQILKAGNAVNNKGSPSHTNDEYRGYGSTAPIFLFESAHYLLCLATFLSLAPGWDRYPFLQPGDCESSDYSQANNLLHMKDE